MPRDGSNTYGPPPGTMADPDTLIESAKHNAWVEDVTQDLNTARPVTAGGTGATTAEGARTNLDVPSNDQAVLATEAQPFSASQKGQARANLDGHLLAGFRNRLINGDFPIWQRATSQTTSGYGSDDRWANASTGSTKTHSRQAFALGQTDVPGEPEFFSRTIVTTVAGAGNYAAKGQNIEDVRTLAGKKATLTIYAKADSAKNVALELFQSFGTGGSPSALNIFSTGKVALTTAWQRFTRVVDIPSIAGETIGSNANDYLGLNVWFDAGSSHNARTDSLGQQSGTFDIAHISLVEGDASSEADPFSPRHIQQEEALCKRYYERHIGEGESEAIYGSGLVYTSTIGLFLILCEPKRAKPTVAFSSPSDFSVTAPVGSQSPSALALQTALSRGNIYVTGTLTGATVGPAQFRGFANSWMSFDAEL